MRSTSSTSRSMIDPAAMLDYPDDLDYEPDTAEEYAEEETEEIILPEPSGQAFTDSSSNCDPPEQNDVSSAIPDKLSLSMADFRNAFGCKKFHLEGNQPTFRSSYLSYAETSRNVYLDSDEEEPGFSDEELDVLESDEEYTQPDESQELYQEEQGDTNYYYSGSYPRSPTSPPLSQNGEDQESQQTPSVIEEYLPSYPGNKFNHVVSMDQENMNPPPSSKKKSSSFNFTIKIQGNERLCLSVARKRRTLKPWCAKVFEVKSPCSDAMLSIKSTDPLVKYCPPFRIDPKEGLSIKSESQTSTNERSLSGGKTFKVPVSRPPTRPDKNVAKSITSFTSPSLEDSTSKDEDNSDIISLIASTTMEDDEQGDAFRHNFGFTPLSNPGTSLSDDAINRVAQWINNEKSSSPQPLRNRTFNIADVPSLFKGLCYYHFFNGMCLRGLQCRNYHESSDWINSSIGRMAMDAPDEKVLQSAYDFSKLHPRSFEKLSPIFVEIFARRDKKTHLIDIIETILDDQNANKVDVVRRVLQCLQKTKNLDIFEDAIFFIWNKVDRNRYPSLGAVLIEIIIMTDALSSNWPILRKFCNFGEQIPRRLWSRFIQNLSRYPMDHRVCQDVLRHISTHKCLHLSEIPPPIGDTFLHMCNQPGEPRKQDGAQPCGERLPTSQFSKPNREVDATIQRNLNNIRKLEEQTLAVRGDSDYRVLPFGNVEDRGNGIQVIADFSVPPPKFGEVPMVRPFRMDSQAQQPANFERCLHYLRLPRFGAANSEPDFQMQTFESLRGQKPLEGPPPISFSRSQPTALQEGRKRRRLSRESFEDVFKCETDSVASSSSGGYFTTSYGPSDNVARRYNHVGLHYDPMKDYIPQTKRFHEDSISTREEVSEFGRLVPKRTANETHASDVRDHTHFDSSTVFFSPPNRRYEHAAPPGDGSQGAGRRSYGEAQSRDPTESHTANEALLSTEDPYCAQDEEFSEFDRLRLMRVDRLVATQKERAKQKIKSPGDRKTAVQVVEGVVSSSSEMQVRNLKPPDQPVFGQIYFDPNYEFNVSLHNLYLQRIDNVDIDEEDVHKLNDCIKYGDGPTFLDLLEKYSCPTTVQNFIAMSLAHLKGTNQMVARLYQKLLQNIEKKRPYYYGDVKCRVILEVISMNLLFELSKRGMFEAARDVLMKFSNWDSLITSRLLITDAYTGVSIVGRYLFIAKLLIPSKPELTFEILVCPNLHFLEEYHKWPYYPQTPIPEIFNADLMNRNLVLDQFFKEAFLKNTVVVSQLYKIALKKNGGIWGYDVRRFINPMILHLIRSSKLVHLKQILKDLSVFLTDIERPTLKAFLLIMYDHLSTQDRFKLYEACMTRNVYQKIFDNCLLVPVVEITTNMTNKEIELIIFYYLHKLVRTAATGGLVRKWKIDIKLPDSGSLSVNSPAFPAPLHRSIMDINAEVKSVLRVKCGIEPSGNLPTFIEVSEEELAKYLQA